MQITRIFTWAGAGRRIIFLFLKLGHLPSCCACHGDRNRDLHSQFNHNRILGGVTHATYTLACISVGSAVTQACVLYGDSVNMHVHVMHDSRIEHIRTVARFIGYNHTNMSRVAWSNFEALSACPLRLPKRLSGERLSEPRTVHDLHEHHAY